jgi:serine/threonine-protein kinase
VKVADLGVAKARGQWRARTRSGELRGKLGYLAPEQLRGNNPDRRADVHALGCVLYLALSGALPYPAEVGSFELVLSGRYRRLHELCPTLPRELCDIVEHALETDREARFPTALALREALETWRERHVIEHGHERIAACVASRLGPFIAARNGRIRSALERHIGKADDPSIDPSGNELTPSAG